MEHQNKINYMQVEINGNVQFMIRNSNISIITQISGSTLTDGVPSLKYQFYINCYTLGKNVWRKPVFQDPLIFITSRRKQLKLILYTKYKIMSRLTHSQ